MKNTGEYLYILGGRKDFLNKIHEALTTKEEVNLTTQAHLILLRFASLHSLQLLHYSQIESL